MKRLLLLSLLFSIVSGCNLNPSKEARIQQLENEIKQLTEKIEMVEYSVQKLDSTNKQLRSKILEFESKMDDED
jgi:prefoldin subunit 5